MGRPKGAKNRPKSLVPTELAAQLLAAVEGYLPKEHVDYLKLVIRQGGVISTKHELDILLAVLNRNLMFAMLEEMPQEELVTDENGEVIERRLKAYAPSKDITDRIKAAKEMLALRNTIEKGEKEEVDADQPLITVIAGRNVDPARVRFILGVDGGTGQVPAGNEPRLLSGDVDLPVGGADEAGAVPVEVAG